MEKINKKGAAADIIYFVISLFAVGVFMLIVWQMWAGMTPTLYDTLGTTAEANASIAAGTTFTNMFDFMFVGGAIGLFIVMVILALLIPTSPVWYIVYIIYLMVATLISAPLSNTYEQIANNTMMTNATTALPMQTYFMLHLPIIVVMFGIILLIATYIKVEGGGRV